MCEKTDESDSNAAHTGSVDSGDDEVRLAEYEALRTESDRISQLLSNAVWAGITAFGLTIAGAAALVEKDSTPPLIVPCVALLLCIQSTAITVVYASELWKYIRVGSYVRKYIEFYFRRKYANTSPPMQWESWIAGHRARSLHIASLVFLQMPILLTLSAFFTIYVIYHGRIPEGQSALTYLAYIDDDSFLNLFLLIIICLDAGAILWLISRLYRAGRGIFSKSSSPINVPQQPLSETEI